MTFDETTDLKQQLAQAESDAAHAFRRIGELSDRLDKALLQRDEARREAEELRAILKRVMPVLADDAMTLLGSSGHDNHQGPDSMCDCECQNAMYAVETLRLAEQAIKEDSPNA